MRALLPAAVVVGLMIASAVGGTLMAQTAPSGLAVPTLRSAPTGAAPLGFLAPSSIDSLRPGGEPVILIHPSGDILVSAHAGETHFKKTTALAPLAVGATGGGQSMMWRSTDDGATWTYVGLPVVNAGPRDAASGFSDPDFALDAAGNVYHTELSALVNIVVRKSTDHGVTWLQTNPAASPLPIDDRQWLATRGSHPTFGAAKVYLVFNELALGWTFLTSTDGGLTFPNIKFIPSDGPVGKMTVDPRDGTIYIGQGADVWRSINGGSSWVVRTPPGHAANCCLSLSPPVVDATGNLYHVWSEKNSIWLGVSSNKGDTWKAVKQVQTFSGTHIFPWITAGAEGRIGIAWLSSTSLVHPESNNGPWHVQYAVSTDANTTTPTLAVTQVTVTAAHTAPICVSGLTCWAFGGDRRLGDYLSVTGDAAGRAHIVYPSTQTNEATSHAMYTHQTNGDLLQ